MSKDYVKEHFDAQMARDDARRTYERTGSEEDRLAKEQAEQASINARKAKEAYQEEQKGASRSQELANRAKAEEDKARMANWRAQMENRKNPSLANQSQADNASRNYQNAKNHADNLRRQAANRNSGLSNFNPPSSDGGSGSSGGPTGANEYGSDTLKKGLADAGNSAKEGADKLANAALAVGSKLNPKIAAAKAVKDGIDGAKQATEKPKSEKSIRELDADEQANQLAGGNFRMEFSKGTMIKLSLGGAAISLILIFFFSVLAFIADDMGAALIMGSLVGQGDINIKDTINLVNNSLGQGTDNEAVGMGPDSKDDPRYEYYKRFEILGNVFSSKYDCDGDVECSVSREEFIYFLKIADITIRYKYKYGINLDWVLLNATAMHNDVSKEVIMGYHQHIYNEDDVENYSILMDLDWDFDYKNIPDYQYLDADDYRYDLQILAKNMVRKTTTQTCTKPIIDSEGRVVGVEVVAERTDLDVEEQYLKPGQPYYLSCPAGTTYNINSNYKLDKDKYHDFLLEYLEHKFYLEGSGKTPLDPSKYPPSSEEGEWIFPLPGMASRCVSSGFGMRFHPIDKVWKMHNGIDYGAPTGTPVYAIADGTVVAAGFESSMGYYVSIEHAGGVKSISMHASALNVQVGQTVKQGDVIMLVGSTGKSTGPHLHLAIYLNGTARDPMQYVGSIRFCG